MSGEHGYKSGIVYQEMRKPDIFNNARDALGLAILDGKMWDPENSWEPTSGLMLGFDVYKIKVSSMIFQEGFYK